jgi:hypothetical protein
VQGTRTPLCKASIAMVASRVRADRSIWGDPRRGRWGHDDHVVVTVTRCDALTGEPLAISNVVDLATPTDTDADLRLRPIGVCASGAHSLALAAIFRMLERRAAGGRVSWRDDPLLLALRPTIEPRDAALAFLVSMTPGEFFIPDCRRAVSILRELSAYSTDGAAGAAGPSAILQPSATCERDPPRTPLTARDVSRVEAHFSQRLEAGSGTARADNDVNDSADDDVAALLAEMGAGLASIGSWLSERRTGLLRSAAAQSEAIARRLPPDQGGFSSPVRHGGSAVVHCGGPGRHGDIDTVVAVHSRR